MDELIKDLTPNEASIIKKEFDKLSDNIKEDFSSRITDYSNSLLFKHYNSFYYFMPKSCLLEIQDKGHNGYYIPPDEYFFINDKRNNKSLIYTSKSETIITPVKKIKTTKVNNDFINLSLIFDNNFEYDYLTLWINPDLVNEDPFFANYLFNQLLTNKNTDKQAKIKFENKTYSTTDIEIKPLNFQFKATEKLILNLHVPYCLYGFQIRIKDLFKYKLLNLKRIDFSLKLKIENYNEEKIKNIFKVNLIPVFNSFNDYSNATFASMNLSEINLKHPEKNDANVVDILSIYENNKKMLI